MNTPKILEPFVILVGYGLPGDPAEDQPCIEATSSARRRRRYSDEEVAIVTAMRVAGKTNLEISVESNIPYFRVQALAIKLLRQGKIPKRKRGARRSLNTKLRAEASRRLNDAGYSKTEIAATFGMDYMQASRDLKRKQPDN